MAISLTELLMIIGGLVGLALLFGWAASAWDASDQRRGTGRYQKAVYICSSCRRGKRRDEINSRLLASGLVRCHGCLSRAVTQSGDAA